MKKVIYLAVFVASLGMLHAQEPVVASHVNETVADSITMVATLPDDFPEPDHFKIKCFSTAPLNPSPQDSIRRFPRIETPSALTNKTVKVKKHKNLA